MERTPLPVPLPAVRGEGIIKVRRLDTRQGSPVSMSRERSASRTITRTTGRSSPPTMCPAGCPRSPGIKIRCGGEMPNDEIVMTDALRAEVHGTNGTHGRDGTLLVVVGHRDCRLLPREMGAA